MANQPPPIEIQFVTKGLDEVQRQLRSIQELTAKVERSSRASSKAKASREEKKAAQETLASLVALAKAEGVVTAASRAGLTARTRVFKQEAKTREQITKEMFAGLAKISEDHRRKEEARNRRDAARSADLATKAAAKERDERARILFGNPGYSRTGAIGRGLASGGRAVAGLARGAMNALGGFSASDAIQQEVALQGRAASIAASSPGDIRGDEIRTRAQGVALAQGIDPSQVLDLYDNIKKLTGQINFAMDAAPDVAKIATATGADLGDVGTLAGNILAANPKTTKDELNAQLRMFAQQGMVGGVELSDFARYGGRITAGASLFGGDASKNQATLGGMAQIARQYGGAASAAEAVLASQRFATDIQKKAGHLKGLGIDVSDGNGTLRSAEDIALQMLDKTGGDVTKLSALQLGERGNRVMTGLSAIYRDAGGGESGKEAVTKELTKYTNASLSQDEVDLRNKKRQAAADIQLNKALIQLRQEVGAHLVPVVSRFASEILIPNMPKIAQMFEAFSKLADFLLNNPFTGLSVVVGASIAKEVALAFAASAFEKKLADAGSSAGRLAGALGVAAAAVIAYQVGKEAIDSDIKGSNDKDAKRRALVNEVTNLTRGGALSMADPESRSRAASLAQQVEQAQKQLSEDAANPSLLKQAAYKAAGLVDPGMEKQARDADKANVDAQQKALTEALQTLTRVMQEQGPPRPPGAADPGGASRGNHGPVSATVRGRPKG